MTRSFEGLLKAEGYSFGIVTSRFNRIFTQQLLDGALDCLKRHGASEDGIDIFWVPGTFEIPVLAGKLAESEKYSAVVCIGALIRGETAHFDHLATQVNRGMAEISLKSGIPITNGILTCDTMDQALARSSAKMGNKGWEAAQSAIEMVNLFGVVNGD